MAKIEKTDKVVPEVKVEDLESLTVEPVEVKVKLVEVNISLDFSAYIGDRNWSFKKGKTSVPEHIKEYLRNANALDAL